MKIEKYKKKSGRVFYRVVDGNVLNKKVLYVTSNEKEAKRFIQLKND